MALPGGRSALSVTAMSAAVFRSPVRSCELGLFIGMGLSFMGRRIDDGYMIGFWGVDFGGGLCIHTFFSGGRGLRNFMIHEF